MQIRKIPIPAGFNKKKLILIFGLMGLILGITIIWVTTDEPQPSRNSAIASNDNQNYAKNDSNNFTDVNDIVGIKKSAISSAPALGLSKIVASGAMSTGLSSQQISAQAQELKAAMKASLSSNQITPSLSTNTGGGSGGEGTSAANIPPAQDSGLPNDDQNMNAQKRNFVKSNSEVSVNIMSNTVQNQIVALVLSMGTKIPAQLDQEINSDLPGQIYGHVSRDVYDSRTHSKLLIPAGSNLVGTYDSALSYGQERLLVAWRRVNFPNGQWLDLPGLGGADPVGAGFGDQVDNHYWRIFGATLFTSVLAAGAQLSQPQQSDALQAPGVGQTLGQSVGTQIANTGTMLLQKNINIKPTLHIRAGFEFTVEVNKDIVFNSAYTGNQSKNDVRL